MLRWLCLRAAATVDVGRDASAEVLRASSGPDTGGGYDIRSAGSPKPSFVAPGNIGSAPHSEDSDITSLKSTPGECIFTSVLRAQQLPNVGGLSTHPWLTTESLVCFAFNHVRVLQLEHLHAT
jgi:hypothetical protein